jgi:hypothetical protein
MKNQMNTLRGLLAVAVLVSIPALIGCTEVSPRIVGGPGLDIGEDPGPVVERMRDVSGTTSVVLAAVGKLNIRQGGNASLRIRAPEKLHDYIRTDVVGGTLVIQVVDSPGFHINRAIEYDLTVPELQYAEVDGVGNLDARGISGDELELVLGGVGNIYCEGLNLNRLEVTRSGEGNLTLSGVAQYQGAVLGGIGNYEARNLDSSVAQITLQGMGSATVQVSDQLDAVINGSGSVYYVGNPAIERSGNGSGGVEQIG